MLKPRVSDVDLANLERYLQELLDRFKKDHGYSGDVQITFSEGKWGFIDNGEFNKVGTLLDLEKWLRSEHCIQCLEKKGSRQHETRNHARDEDGHLMHFDDWNDAWMRIVSKEEGIEMLIDEHMRVIEFLRKYYTKNGVPPMIRVTSMATETSLRKLYDLFPKGIYSAYKIAGLPRGRGDV